jgi:hypothetical protein
MTDQIEIHYDGDGWAALYINGKLHQVGDAYVAEEEALSRAGVTTVRDPAFMRGQKGRDGVAQTVDEVTAYREQRDADVRLAAEKIAAARKLLMEAKTLDPDGRTDHGVGI